jgi:hypothetical protein
MRPRLPQLRRELPQNGRMRPRLPQLRRELPQNGRLTVAPPPGSKIAVDGAAASWPGEVQRIANPVPC